MPDFLERLQQVRESLERDRQLNAVRRQQAANERQRQISGPFSSGSVGPPQLSRSINPYFHHSTAQDLTPVQSSSPSTSLLPPPPPPPIPPPPRPVLRSFHPQVIQSDSRSRFRNALQQLSDMDPESRAFLSPEATLSNMRPPLPRARSSQRFNRISQRRRERAQESSSSLVDLHEAGERLAQVNENLRNLLDQPVGDRYTPSAGRIDGSEAYGPRKRRKIEHNSRSRRPKIEYGEYGQIKPGRLTMQLLSCDGGTFEPSPRAPYSMYNSHAAKNMLKDDRSVYSTKSPRCNIVLCHQGETPFDIQKIVIKAPQAGYSDPVQDGLIFVSMDQNDAFDRTTQYQIHHFSTCRFGPYYSQTQRAHESPPHVQDGLVHLYYGGNREDTRCESPPSYEASTRRGPGSRRLRNVVLAEDSSSEEETGARDPLLGVDADTLRRVLHSARQTPDAEREADFDDRDGGYQSLLAQLDFDEVLRRLNNDARPSGNEAETPALEAGPNNPASDDICSSDYDNEYLDPLAHFSMPSSGHCHRHAHLRRSPTVVIYDAMQQAIRNEGSESVHPSTSEDRAARLLPADRAPPVRHAPESNRHSTARQRDDLALTDEESDSGADARRRRTGYESSAHNSEVVLVFDPPRSARYLLLKLWNARGESRNIDIERVEVHGYAGVRWFPAAEVL